MIVTRYRQLLLLLLYWLMQHVSALTLLCRSGSIDVILPQPTADDQ